MTDKADIDREGLKKYTMETLISTTEPLREPLADYSISFIEKCIEEKFGYSDLAYSWVKSLISIDLGDEDEMNEVIDEYVYEHHLVDELKKYVTIKYEVDDEVDYDSEGEDFSGGEEGMEFPEDTEDTEKE